MNAPTPIANQSLNDVLDYIEAQFDKLQIAAIELRRSSVQLACSTAAEGDKLLYRKLLKACGDAEIERCEPLLLALRLQRVIGYALAQHNAAKGGAA